MAVGIKNYTSGVSADDSVRRIKKCLVANGAMSIMEDYDTNGNVISIAFRHNHRGEFISFKLPAKIEPLFKVFKREHPKTKDAILLDQAKRTAWKNISDWVELQMTMIKLEQIEFNEVFLPFMLVGNGETVYDKFKETGLKQLGQ